MGKPAFICCLITDFLLHVQTPPRRFCGLLPRCLFCKLAFAERRCTIWPQLARHTPASSFFSYLAPFHFCLPGITFNSPSNHGELFKSDHHIKGGVTPGNYLLSVYFVRAKYNKVFPREKRREREGGRQREREGVDGAETYRPGGLPGGR